VIAELVSGDVPSTKAALGALAAVTGSDKVLVVMHRDEDLAWLSLRNVITAHVLTADQLNAYDVLVNDEVVFTSAALRAYIDHGSATTMRSELVEGRDDALRQAQGASDAQGASEGAPEASEGGSGRIEGG
jgi:Ribosomal protein L4/L1 family